MKTCPFCTTEAPDDARMCVNCGKPFEQPDAAPVAPGDAAPPPPTTGDAQTGASADSSPGHANGEGAATAAAPAPPPAAEEITLTTCPQCKEPWKPGAVLCLSCGYDARVGRRLSTVHGVEEPPPVVRPTAGLGPVRTGLVLHAVRVGLLIWTIFLGLLVAVLAIQIRNAEEFTPHAVKLPEENLPPPTPGENPANAPVETAPEPPSYAPVVAALVLSLIACVLALAQPVLGIIGSIQCLRAPREAKARRWIAASLAFDVAAFLAAGGVVGWACWQLTSLHLDPSKPPDAADLTAWPLRLASLPGVAAWVLLMLFAGKLGLFYERRDEALQAVTVIISGLVLLFAFPVIVVPLLLEMANLLGRDPLGALIVLVVMSGIGMVWLGFGIWLFFQQLGVINGVREALRPKPSEPAAEPVGESV